MCRRRLGVVGAGVIGLEMGSVWRRLGARGHGPRSAAGVPRRGRRGRSRRRRRSCSRSRVSRSSTGVKITDVNVGKDDVTVEYTDAAGKAQTATFDRLIVSIGRVPLHRPGSDADAVGLAARRARLRRRRRRVPHQSAERLGDRRRRARPDARAQGRGRRRGRRRAHRRPARPRRLQHDAVGHLHVARDRVGRADRAATEGGRRRLPRRHLSVHGQRPRARARRHHAASSRSSPTQRPTGSSACTSSAPWRRS